MGIIKGFVRDLIDKDRAIICTKPDATVLEVVEKMSKAKVGAIMIRENERLVGLFSERDLMKCVVAKHLPPETTPVSDVMLTHVAVGTMDMSLNDAANLISEYRLRYLPIIEDKKVVGMISAGDIFAHHLEDQKNKIQHLEDYFFN